MLIESPAARIRLNNSSEFLAFAGGMPSMKPAPQTSGGPRRDANGIGTEVRRKTETVDSLHYLPTEYFAIPSDGARILKSRQGRGFAVLGAKRRRTHFHRIFPRRRPWKSQKIIRNCSLTFSENAIPRKNGMAW